VEGRDRLGRHIREGNWLWIDERGKWARVYWPDKMTVTVERNIYFNKSAASVSHAEGEERHIFETETDTPLPQKSSQTRTTMSLTCSVGLPTSPTISTTSPRSEV